MGSKQLEVLQEGIKDRQERNTDNVKFVPYTWLEEVLTENQIQQVLISTSIEEDERPFVAATVRASGLRIFAILVLMGEPALIYNFIQSDQYVNKDNLDNQLPLMKEKLNELFGVTRFEEELAKFMKGKEPTECKGDPEYVRLRRQISKRVEWASDFESTQYMFLSPTFPQGTPHRIISNNIRLPFLLHEREPPLTKKPTGGHFGSVFKERLPSLQYGSANKAGILLCDLTLLLLSDNSHILGNDTGPEGTEIYG
jgi:hypothetical protein